MVLGGAAGGGSILSGMTLRDVELIGVPTNSTRTVDGAARAPAVLRRGLGAALAGGAGLADPGDVTAPVPRPWRGPARPLPEGAPGATDGRLLGGDPPGAVGGRVR